MQTVTLGSVRQGEIEERFKKLQELFANDPAVARLEYRFGGDWSGDDSLFIDVVLNKQTPTATVLRLSKEIAAALIRVVRSEELDLHSYFNFVRTPENGQ